MRRSAGVLEKLACELPYSALALCRLVRPRSLDVISSASSSERNSEPTPPRRPSPTESSFSATLSPTKAVRTPAVRSSLLHGGDGDRGDRYSVASTLIGRGGDASSATLDPSGGGVDMEGVPSWRALPTPSSFPVADHVPWPRRPSAYVESAAEFARLVPPPPLSTAPSIRGEGFAMDEIGVGGEVGSDGSVLLQSLASTEREVVAGSWGAVGSNSDDDAVVQDISWP